MKRCLGCLLLLIAQSAFPCVWVLGTKYNGMPGWVSGMGGDRYLRHMMERNPGPDGERMEAELRSATGFTNRSDYCVALMYLGRSQEAVTRLEQLEREQPGHYYIAANLGTAYELAGNNAKALHWIREGMKRNPDSHGGTEWLHARILETKLALEKDPHHLRTHSVLELHPASINEEIAIDGQRMSAADVRTAIEYQLIERMQFVKPPDAVVASLIYDYAAIDAVGNSLESARKVIQLAITYGYPQEGADRLLKSFERRIFWANVVFWGVVSLAILGGAWLLYVLYRRGIFILSWRRP